MALKSLYNKFWDWYNQYYLLNLSLAAFLFTLQLIHLYWLSADVVATRLINQSYFSLSGIWYLFILVVDYTEIPALITTSLVYINELNKKFNWKSVLFLIFLNTQWIHIFWITDEFVIDQFIGTNPSTILPLWLAWVAIVIDYLELPVIFDTIKKLILAIKDRNLKELKQAFKED